jgi:hypothetical protein
MKKTIFFIVIFLKCFWLVPMMKIYWEEAYIPLTQYCAGDKIEKNEIGWSCDEYV